MEHNLSHLIALHQDRAIAVGQAQTNCGYAPNYSFAGEFVDDFHEFLGTSRLKGSLIDIGIPGWLRREDALKLYELGRFAEGDILEFGTNRGLSTFILANAMKNSFRQGEIVTMELSREISDVAKQHLSERKVVSDVRFAVGDANTTCLSLVAQGRKFGFSFIDHSHAYEHMVKACRRLSELMLPGAFCVFHDYNDPRNSRRTGLGEVGEEYGVQAAIEDALDPNHFEFVGVYGCTGVYRCILPNLKASSSA
ncbi:hypothetical protein BLJAPNOD_05534 [Ensifer sp. M14]|uniref:class I SAM-dependent methyltransferase n=1 Tax=Ensifer sp. M14 TaxID=2203782 RepID=UPI000E1DDB16|nr:class I SAM-dependent methyltransferase [Ensifer sp. M14]RDL47610.1 hypothetical protein BLJAPNOD_05534 [Ensifer sp. M14]